MTKAPSIKEAFDEWFASNYGWLGVGDQLLKSDMKQAWDAALATLQPSGEQREAIEGAIGKHFGPYLAISPTTRYEAVMREFTRDLLASGLVQYEAGIRADEREKCAKIAEKFGEPYALNTNTGAMMFRAQVSKIAAAIRSARDGGAET